MQRLGHGDRRAGRSRCVQNNLGVLGVEWTQRRDVTRSGRIECPNPIFHVGQEIRARDRAVRAQGDIREMAVLKIGRQHRLTSGLESGKQADGERVSVGVRDDPPTAAGLFDPRRQVGDIVREILPIVLPPGADRHQITIAARDGEQAGDRSHGLAHSVSPKCRATSTTHGVDDGWSI